MARKFIFDNDSQKNSFLGYQRGMVRRVITVATPHLGSNWANFLVGRNTNTLYKREGGLHFASSLFIENRNKIASFVDSYSNWRKEGYEFRVFQDKYDSEGKRLPISALTDLAIGSPLLGLINRADNLPNVPMYSISGNASDQFYVSANVGRGILEQRLTMRNPLFGILIAMDKFYRYKLGYTDAAWLVDWFKVIFESKNDLVVDNSSSKWIFENNHTVYDDPPVPITFRMPNHWHSGITETSDVGRQILNLLRGPVSNFIDLSKSDFGSTSASVSSYGALNAGETFIMPPLERISITEIEAIELNILQSDEELTTGDIIIIEATVAPEVGYAHDTLFLHYSNNNGMGVAIMEDDGSGTYRIGFQMLDDHVGTLDFFTYIPDFDNDIMYTSNIVSRRIVPELSNISRIGFLGDPFIITEGTESEIAILCYDSDEKVTYQLSNDSGIVFTIQNNSIAEVTNGILKAKTPGRTTITAFFHGFGATCELIVIPDDSHLIPKGPVINTWDLPALPLFPDDGATIYLGEAFSFVVSERLLGAPIPQYTDWRIINEKTGERQTSIVAPARGNTARWTPSAPGTYVWDMRYVFFDLYLGPGTIIATTWSRPRTLVVEAGIPVTGISLSAKTLTLMPGESAELFATVTPESATFKNVIWSTSDRSVASMSDGMVWPGAAYGTATIRAAWSWDRSIFDECVVTVLDPIEVLREYYQKKYPGRNIVVGDSSFGPLVGTNGNDVLVANGKTRLEGGGGNDIYIWLPSTDGSIVIPATGWTDGQTNELHIGPGVSKNDLEFERVEDDLYIKFMDGDYEIANVMVEGWFLAGENRFSKIVFDDRIALNTEEIQKLVVEAWIKIGGLYIVNTWRGLVVAMSTSASGDVIRFSRNIATPKYPVGNLDIYAWLPELSKNLTIDGAGHKVDFLWSPYGGFSIYGDQYTGQPELDTAVTFKNLTFMYGNVTSGVIRAGNVRLSFENCVFTENGHLNYLVQSKVATRSTGNYRASELLFLGNGYLAISQCLFYNNYFAVLYLYNSEAVIDETSVFGNHIRYDENNSWLAYEPYIV